MFGLLCVKKENNRNSVYEKGNTAVNDHYRVKDNDAIYILQYIELCPLMGSI